VQEAKKFRPLCHLVHQEDGEASPQGDGLGLLKLERERGLSEVIKREGGTSKY
jgi:hypothetical protein